MRALGSATIVIGLCAGTSSASPVRDSTAEPHDGIVREQWSDAAIPATLELIRIDLTSSEIAMHATPEAQKGKTTSAFAGQPSFNAAVAINGDAFAAATYRPRGLAMGESMMWSQTADDDAVAVLHFRRTGEHTSATIVPPETPVAAADLPMGTQGVVSGRPLLVREGNVETGFDCNDAITVPCVRAPRSAVGITGDGNTLLLVAVDGWQSGSSGMTAAEVATFLRARGATSAMMLDSGSSSTLVLDGAVINRPSDGVERTVANHLAFKFGSLPKGELFGLVCDQNLTDCLNSAPGSPLRIEGAKVTLDDGRVDTTNSDGEYSFINITPRLACVTVQKTGFQTKVKCGQVPAGGIGYNSLALYPGVDLVDAGVPDAPETTIDAPDGGDDPTGDAGPSVTGDGGGGCCDAGRARPPLPALLVLVGWLSISILGRRRGTTRS